MGCGEASTAVEEVVQVRESFTHLHVHTEYSMLDGASRLDELVAAAAADGMPALGITDHGNMYGVLDFYRECKQRGIKPVLGSEMYMAHEHRSERPSRRGRIDDTGGDADGGKKLYYHLTVLAENDRGYRNLIQMSSLAFLEGYYYKPRMDWELLERYHEGLIATTGCLGGHVLQSLMNGDERGALEKAARLQDIFGRDHLFIELQDQGLQAQRQTNPKLLDIARKLQAPIVATNDSHYTHREDHLAHDALLCVQTGALMSDPKRFKFEGDQHYLKPSHEMRYLFRELPEACDNTLWIAERADVTIEFGKPQLPSFPLPPGFDSDTAYLEHLTFRGAEERWGSPLPADVVERLAYELRVIADMGFSSYFLIVWDLIKHAKDHGIRVGPGRGSAAGCAVAYCLRITDLDPIKYDLLFERFLNPSRISMPDIDMDFDSRYRDEMITYAASRYGRDHVAQIVTFSTIKARAAVRDAARVLGYPYAVGDKVAKAMPPLVMGRDTPLYACLEEHPKFEDGYKAAADLRAMYHTDPDVKRVVDVARGLEGLRRQDGIHAAAVVITKEPLTDYLPIQRKPEPGQDPEQAPIVTQYEMHGVEELGLLKMDFLGLRNLDVITDAVEMIRSRRDASFDIDAIALDDGPTLDLLKRGEGIGVFQLEGGPMRALMRSLAPTSFDDVAALVALYRPGPMAANMHNDYADRKNGRKTVALPHEDAAELLLSTYGLCLTGDTRVIDVATGHPLRLDEVRPEEGVLLQGVDDQFRPTVERVTAWVCNGERETVRLRLRNGMTLAGTPDHRVLTYDGWKELGALTPSDRVGVPRSLCPPVTSRVIEPDRLRILGYLLADGGLSVRSAVVFSNSDLAVLEAFRASLATAFPTVRPSEREGARRVHHLTLGNGKGNGGGASPLLRWLRALGLKFPAGSRVGGPGSADKFVPAPVFELDDEAIGVFLAALWDCDGHVSKTIAYLKTVSPRLAEDTRLLLMRLGFEVAVYESDAKASDGRVTNRAFQVTVYDGPLFDKWIRPHLVHPAKADTTFDATPKGPVMSRSAFLTELRSVVPGGRRRLAASTGIDLSSLSSYAESHHPWVHEATIIEAVQMFGLESSAKKLRVLWVPVVEVTTAGKALVYDITVENCHNFIANGMVAHNCVYQEQVMRLAQKFAGYSLAEADNLRKACGKKSRPVMAAERAKFIAGCESTGYGADVGNMWFDIIEPFADYAFNKSHSYGYGLVAYQTAYLKAHHPVEYLACLLTSVKTNLDKAAVYLAECRNYGIKVLNPDINLSQSDFAALSPAEAPAGVLLSPGSPGAITFGLSAVRNVGEGVVDLVIKERATGGPFTSFHDFAERVDPAALNKRSVESLVKAGAFDTLGHPRRGLLAVFEQVIDTTLARRRERDQGIMSLFGDLGATGGGGFDERIAIPELEFDKVQRLRFEKEMLGLYVSDHPLMGAEWAIRRRSDCSLAELRDREDGAQVTVGGVVTSLARKFTKKGDAMAVFVLEDLQDSIEVMVFPRVMSEHGYKLTDDTVVTVRGRVDHRDDTPKLMAQDITVVEGLSESAPPLKLRLPATSLTEDKIAQLKRILSEHPGDSRVFVHMGEGKVLRLTDEFCVDLGRVVGELRVAFGHGVVEG
jgi:DNA polymerase III subunit alpha